MSSAENRLQIKSQSCRESHFQWENPQRTSIFCVFTMPWLLTCVSERLRVCAISGYECRAPHVPLVSLPFPHGQPPWPPHSHQPCTHVHTGQPSFEGWVINVPSDTPSSYRGSLGWHTNTHTRSCTHTHAYKPALTCLHEQVIHHTVLTGWLSLSAVSGCMMVTPRLAQRDHHGP